MNQNLKVENLGQLKDALKACERGVMSYDDVMNAAKIEISDIDFAIRWDLEKYTRTVLAKSEAFELLLLCWEPNQQSPIHDHNKQQCWMRVVAGELMEERFEIGADDVKPKLTSRHPMCSLTCAYIADSIGIHRLLNESTSRSISLHLYAKPIDSIMIYSECGKKSAINLVS